MASYSPLRMHDLDHQPEDGEDDILLPGRHITSEHRTMDPRSKQPAWATLGLQVIAIICACALYNIASASVSGKRNVQGLRQPNQFPGIELVGDAQQKEKAPKLFFPSAIVRVNKALPDQVYTSSSHVILSDSDSMFFQWHLGRSRFTSCYIDSIVPTVEDGLAANKSYTSSGSITEIQIWNVTTPAEGITSLSWNTRPRRIALMGTVAFLPEEEKIEQLGLEDGWQSQLATRFSCGKEASVVTVEVACDGCRIEFEQLFSVPPLAFDLMEIG
ncbi:hypothetical protein DFJ58DRAFT_716748 [Suillus subalutaceus]|uniref:uncharacterized protein n=1 Tax=Suillus subalutaceus TaxID=48586 RepID=UPI001B87C592|nr:uncharacterized protein DFJ58DRAFT_716748 [Suillus subalutaceus]KAG1850795.1 hypothetical protein DFJ58DRAFT_716748 [Suillus subalutaceus]